MKAILTFVYSEVKFSCPKKKVILNYKLINRNTVLSPK